MKIVSKVYIASAIVSICGITFQVLLGALGSYTFGDSVKQFAFTIGLFLSGMGIGSAISEKVMKNLIHRFIQIEFAVGVVGGFSSFLLFFILAYFDFALGQFFLYSVTIFIGALTGLELPILIRKASEIGEELNKSAARVLFSDYAGSLIGAIGFVLVLRPWLGLIKTAFFIGIINLIIALWMVYTFRKELHRPVLYQAVGIGLVVLLFSGFLFGESYAYGFEQKLYRDQIVRSLETEYQRIIVTKEDDDTRLFLNGNIQFSSTDEYRYHESLVHPAMSLAKHHDRVLILGGGDGIAMRELLKYNDLGRVTLVDLDQKLVEFAREEPLLLEVNQGALESDKLRIIYEDAFQYLLHDRALYDVIIVDLPDPNNESLNKLYTVEFYSLMKKRLTPSGMAAIQSTSPLFARKAYWTIDKTIQEAGLYTDNYHVDVPSFGDWGFTLASRNEFSIENMDLKVKTKYLSEELIPSLFVFPKDENANIVKNGKVIELVPNTMNRPVLLQHYQDAWRNY
jgi:spermidine synthase